MESIARHLSQYSKKDIETLPSSVSLSLFDFLCSTRQLELKHIVKFSSFPVIKFRCIYPLREEFLALPKIFPLIQVLQFDFAPTQFEFQLSLLFPRLRCVIASSVNLDVAKQFADHFLKKKEDFVFNDGKTIYEVSKKTGPIPNADCGFCSNPLALNDLYLEYPSSRKKEVCISIHQFCFFVFFFFLFFFLG
jgi:hypothetical protein